MLGTEDEKPGSSSAPDTADVEQQEESGPPEDIDAEALELMGQGKRNLVVGDPPAAVQCFQEACELLASKYGETAEECGDAYYQYGCSLLELASMENGVLGNALQGVPEDSADSADSDDEGAEKPSGSTVESADKLEAKEREEVIQQVKDALEANCESEESEKEDKGKEGKEGEEKEEDEEEKMEEGGDNKEAEAAKQEDEKKDDKEELKEEKKDEKKVEEKEVEEKEKESGEEKKDVEKKVEEKDEKKVEQEDEKKEDEKKDEEQSEKEGEKKDTITEKADVADKTEKKEKKDGDDDDDEEAGPSAEDDQKEDGDDISNFQLAWEMLELSRVIISKKDDKESQMKTSQIHLKLGELGLETEQYTQSIVDFKACLDIQKKYLDPESRLIAGTHYNLGLACSFAQQFDESIEHYRESKQLIEKRLASLEKKVSETEGKGKEKADENDPLVCAQKEMDELKELLPDVVSKLEDAKEMKLQAASSSSAGAGPSSSTSTGFASSSSGFAPSSSSEPVQQIAVRKKRKPEESDAAADSKRSRQEENGEKPALNGSGDTKAVNGNGQMANGVMNGDMNGDSKHSPEKPAEIKTKKLTQDGEAPAAMETS